MKTTSKNSTITLSEMFDKSISSRSAIVNLFHNIDTEKARTVSLDFEKIAFISRSASHQLIVEKKKLEKENIEVTFVKMITEIKKMIDVVMDTLDKPKEVPKIQHLHFSSKKNLESFLLRV